MADAIEASSLFPSQKLFSRDDFVYDEHSEEDYLGCGSFAEVYKASMRSTGQVVAAKVLFRQNGRRGRLQKDEIKSLRKEAAILFQVQNHPNIIQLIGICEAPRHYALLLEFMSDGNLDTVLHSTSDKDVDSWKTRIDMAYQISNGMNHLHSLDPPIIHRDLKPQNVLLRKEERFYTCKITDFGLSKMKGMTTTTHDISSSDYTPAGTVLYIAHEGYSTDYNPTAELRMKLDIYSFGVILWEIRERRRPWDGKTDKRVLHHLASTGKALPVAKNPCPFGYEDLGQKCISYEPESRPSFHQISISLQDIGRELNESGRTSPAVAHVVDSNVLSRLAVDDFDGASLDVHRLLSMKDKKGLGKRDSSSFQRPVNDMNQSVTSSSARGAFPANEDIVSENLMRACATRAASKWEEMGILLDVQDLDEIRERYRGIMPRMFKVLELWKMREQSPTVGKLLRWFQEVGVSRYAIKSKYEELFSRK
ncbi:putative mitogen-activated protein kinase kinase kinase 7-like isoform X2 [Oscarella lobularis]|uniref:putative mitogen-activated protein kinase kinase kinase 7-like isoform X2 n=1 Tax=Oscarella lobularis TaxID=121494 RepID=UPI0033143D94